MEEITFDINNGIVFSLVKKQINKFKRDLCQKQNITDDEFIEVKKVSSSKIRLYYEANIEEDVKKFIKRNKSIWQKPFQKDICLSSTEFLQFKDKVQELISPIEDVSVSFISETSSQNHKSEWLSLIGSSEVTQLAKTIKKEIMQDREF